MIEQIQHARGIDWTALIAAVFAGVNGVLITFFYLRGKSRQDATDQELRLIKGRAEIAAQHAANASQHTLRTIEKVEQSQRETIAKVEQSKQERTVQIDEVKAGLETLKTKVEEGINVSNGYNGKIAAAASATQAVAEQVQRIAESQSQAKP